jgi:hypothetical protein
MIISNKNYLINKFFFYYSIDELETLELTLIGLKTKLKKFPVSLIKEKTKKLIKEHHVLKEKYFLNVILSAVKQAIILKKFREMINFVDEYDNTVEFSVPKTDYSEATRIVCSYNLVKTDNERNEIDITVNYERAGKNEKNDITIYSNYPSPLIDVMYYMLDIVCSFMSYNISGKPEYRVNDSHNTIKCPYFSIYYSKEENRIFIKKPFYSDWISFDLSNEIEDLSEMGIISKFIAREIKYRIINKKKL